MSSLYRAIEVKGESTEKFRIAYLDYPTDRPLKATILLLHGFPQTSYQFRHVLPQLVDAGYRCIVPDYRGAGRSSTNHQDFRKTTMAADMIALLDALHITERVHVIGHDIGGMIAFALASRHPERVASVVWGECPLPGTSAYHINRRENAVDYFHFIFHSLADLPAALVAGRERIYVSHFLEKITHNMDAFSEADIDHYAAAYARPGAMRCAFGVYRAFETDAEENQDWVRKHGKCKVPSLVLSGEVSRHREESHGMVREVTDAAVVEDGVVEGASHYLAEESPNGFIKAVLPFLEKH